VLVPDWSAARRVWVLVVVCGLPLLLGQFSRSRGRRLEPALFKQWGGKPNKPYNGLPRTVPLGHVPPGSAGAGTPAYAVCQLPLGVHRRPSRLLPNRQ
jgi:hypothetical protein